MLSERAKVGEVELTPTVNGVVLPTKERAEKLENVCGGALLWGVEFVSVVGCDKVNVF